MGDFDVRSVFTDRIMVERTSRRAKMTSSDSFPVPCVTTVPVTATLSLSPATNAQDIKPRPTATPFDGSAGVLAVEPELDAALEIFTGAGAEFDSRGSRT
jgi:hypothetical protein